MQNADHRRPTRRPVAGSMISSAFRWGPTAWNVAAAAAWEGPLLLPPGDVICPLLSVGGDMDGEAALVG